MRPLIETLESRQMLAFTPGYNPPVLLQTPAINVPVNQPAFFSGYATKTDGSKAAQVLVKLTKYGNAYKAEVTAIDKDGSVDKIVLNFDAKGKCIYDRVDAYGKFHLEAKIATDGSKITGNWIDYKKSGNSYVLDSKGTVLLNRVSALPTSVDYMKFTGIAVDKNGYKDTLQISLTKTDKGYRAEVKLTGSDGHTQMKIFNFVLTNGKYVFDGVVDGEKLHVEMQLGANNQSLTGTWKSTHTDGGVGTGTFSAKRVA